MTATTDATGQVQLVCPKSKLPLTEVALADAERNMGKLAPRKSMKPAPYGRTNRVMVRSDGRVAYPIVSEIPVLLYPEQLLPVSESFEVDLHDPKYEEAYSEMDHYNAVATDELGDLSASGETISLELPSRACDAVVSSFPEPRTVWADGGFDTAAHMDCLRHLAPVAGARHLQIGGRGKHAVKMLLAGAQSAWLATPMLDEIRFARALASYFGVESRLSCVAAVGEELPFADSQFDGAYAGGCLHHMQTDLALAEAARVLAPGGKFAAVDPFRAPLYGLGTRMLGKREPNVHCRPLTEERLLPLDHAFQTADVIHHGALSRYALIALMKLGVSLPPGTLWRIGELDDFVCSVCGRLRTKGSLVAVLGTK
jgi:SAM-dependent methyltransferase/uncharacterized protein YbaR (Trm112 family)